MTILNDSNYKFGNNFFNRNFYLICVRSDSVHSRAHKFEQCEMVEKCYKSAFQELS